MNEETTAKQRIEKIIADKGLNPNRMEVMCKLKKNAISDLIHGAKTSITEKLSKAIVETFPDINPEWLRSGIGPAYLWQYEDMKKVPISATIPETSRIKDLEEQVKSLQSELSKSNSIISELSNSNRILSETNRALVQSTMQQKTTVPRPYMGYASEPDLDIPQARDVPK